MTQHNSNRQPIEPHAQEVRTEREILVTGGDRRSSGPGTAVVLVFALIALAAIVFLSFAFFERDGENIPDDVNISIDLPNDDQNTN
ncbi:MAG: hypothetical protein WD360_06160 [Nitriliruptoraceae bacterium]